MPEFEIRYTQRSDDVRCQSIFTHLTASVFCGLTCSLSSAFLDNFLTVELDFKDFHSGDPTHIQKRWIM